MKVALVLIIGLAGGFAAGIFLSEVIGIAGVLMFDRMVGVKYLSVYTALIGAGLALLVSRRTAQKGSPSA